MPDHRHRRPFQFLLTKRKVQEKWKKKTLKRLETVPTIQTDRIRVTGRKQMKKIRTESGLCFSAAVVEEAADSGLVHFVLFQ